MGYVPRRIVSRQSTPSRPKPDKEFDTLTDKLLVMLSIAVSSLFIIAIFVMGLVDLANEAKPIQEETYQEAVIEQIQGRF